MKFDTERKQMIEGSKSFS